MKIAWLGQWSDVPLFVMFALPALKPNYFAKRTANHILCAVRSGLGVWAKKEMLNLCLSLPWRVSGNITYIWCIHLQGELCEIWVFWSTNANWWLKIKKEKQNIVLKKLWKKFSHWEVWQVDQMDFFLTVSAHLDLLEMFGQVKGAPQADWICYKGWWWLCTPPRHLTFASFFFWLSPVCMMMCLFKAWLFVSVLKYFYST